MLLMNFDCVIKTFSTLLITRGDFCWKTLCSKIKSLINSLLNVEGDYSVIWDKIKNR